MPRAQLEHELAAVAVEKVPAEQLEHTVAPLDEVYLPCRKKKARAKAEN